MSNRETSPAAPRGRDTAPEWLKNVAIISGLLGFVLFLLTPFLPVNQTQSSFSWPQGDSLNSVNAPLVSYAPERIDVELAPTRRYNPELTII